MKDRKSKSQTAHTHNFIDYKIVPKQEYQSYYKFVNEPKPEEFNSIYRHLKGQRIINQVFSRIFGSKKRKKMTKSQMEQSNLFKVKSFSQINQSLRNFSSLSSSNKVAERQNTLQKVSSFNQSLKSFHKSMTVNRKRVNILNKFNKKVKQFEQKLPKDPSQQTRQSLEQNDKLIKICIQDSLAKHQKQSFNQRYEQIMQYKQPRIDEKIKKDFLKKKYNSKIREIIKTRDTKIKTLC